MWVLQVCGQDGWLARGNKWMPCYHEPRKALGISMLYPKMTSQFIIGTPYNTYIAQFDLINT